MSSPAPASRGRVWSEVVAASGFVAAIERPGFSVWDALDEAIRWWIIDLLSIEGEVDVGIDLPWNDPDPLRTTLNALFETAPTSGAVDGHELSTVLDSALRVWLARTADRVNDGQRFSCFVVVEAD